MCVSKAWCWGCASCCGNGAVSESRSSCCAIKFPSPLTLGCPWSRAPGWGRRFFRPPLHPSPPPSLPELGGPAVLFHTFSTKRPCFFTLVTSRPGGGGWEVAGDCPVTQWLHISGSRSFPHCSGFSLCLIPVISIQMGPRWPEPLVQLPWCEACVWLPGCGDSVGTLHARAKLSLRLAQRFRCGASWLWLLPPTVIQWDLIGKLAATEAEDSPAPQNVPPIPKRPCQFASSFSYNVFQSGWRPSVVLPQLEAEPKEMGLDCNWRDLGESQTMRKGLATGGWPPGGPCGGRFVERGEDGIMPGGSRPSWGGTGWLVINRQGGYFTGVERVSSPPLLQD